MSVNRFVNVPVIDGFALLISCRYKWMFMRYSVKSQKFIPHKLSFYFLITHEVCKKRKYCNSMSEKEKFSPFAECSCLYGLKDKTNKKNSVCLSVCLAVWLYIRTWILAVDTITFEGVSGPKQNLVGVFYL